MKKIKVENKYITNIEVGTGKLVLIEFKENNQPVKFTEEDIEYFKAAIEEYYKDKEVEIVIEDYFDIEKSDK